MNAAIYIYVYMYIKTYGYIIIYEYGYKQINKFIQKTVEKENLRWRAGEVYLYSEYRACILFGDF